MIINSIASKGDVTRNSKKEIAEIIKCGSELPGGDDIWLGGNDENRDVVVIRG